eukprot:354803-Chlamydomonas_euryale.AAC.2
MHHMCCACWRSALQTCPRQCPGKGACVQPKPTSLTQRPWSPLLSSLLSPSSLLSGCPCTTSEFGWACLKGVYSGRSAKGFLAALPLPSTHSPRALTLNPKPPSMSCLARPAASLNDTFPDRRCRGSCAHAPPDEASAAHACAHKLSCLLFVLTANVSIL